MNRTEIATQPHQYRTELSQRMQFRFEEKYVYTRQILFEKYKHHKDTLIVSVLKAPNFFF